MELELKYLGLQVFHELVEAVELEIFVALLAEEMNLQGSVDHVLSLQALLVVNQIVVGFGVFVDFDASFASPRKAEDFFHLLGVKKFTF